MKRMSKGNYKRLVLIRPPQLQFFKDGIKIAVMDRKYYQMEN